MSNPEASGSGGSAATEHAVPSASPPGALETQRHTTDASSSGDANRDGSGPAIPLDHTAQSLSWKQLADLASSLAQGGPSSSQASSGLQLLKIELPRRFKAGESPPASAACAILGSIAALTGDEARGLLSPLLDVLRPDLGALQAQEISAVLQALVASRHHPGKAFLELICKQAAERPAASLSLEDLSLWSWTVAWLGGVSSVPQLLSVVIKRQQAAQAVWQLKDIGRVLWTLAATGVLSDESAAALCMDSLAIEEMAWDALLCIAAAYLALPSLAYLLPQPLLLEALQARKQQLAAEGGTPHLEAVDEIGFVLAEMGLEHVKGVWLEEGLLRLDLALPRNQIALCFDAGESFAANAASHPLGTTILNWRLIALRGWKVVSLPAKEWSALQSRAQRAAHLQKLLQGPSALEKLQQAQSAAATGVEPSELRSLRRASDASSALREAGSSATGGGVETESSGPSRSNLGSSTGVEGSSSLPELKKQQSNEQTLPGLSGLSTRLDSGASSSGQEGGPPLFGLNVPGASSEVLQDQLPALTKPNAPNARAYWDQVALASRLAAMRMMPQPPLTVGPLSESSSTLPEASLLNLGAPAHRSPEFPSSIAGLPSRVPAEATGLAAGSLQQLSGVPDLSFGQFTAGFPGQPPASSAIRGPAAKQAGPQTQGDLRQLWQMVTQVVPGQTYEGPPKTGVSVGELKRVIELLPLETSAMSAVAPRLALLDPPQFADLLTELARDNHAFRAWQLFDWVRALPEDNELRNLCDSNTYTTMISLCGPWQQVRRALSLVADMRARSLECGVQAYSALLNAAVKCGEVELAVDVYRQMGQEGMERDKPIFQMMVDVFVKMGRPADALAVLDDVKKLGQPAEVQLYNLIVLSCTKMNNPRAALDVYKRMAEDGVQPNTKTFTALIGSVGKMNTVDQAMEIIEELLSPEQDSPNLTQTYSALMSACEKAGQWDLAVALFDRMSGQGCKPDVSIFNSMIAACAHGGEFNKARLMFERMPDHDCVPDAVTYANLIRAYKKGGQWCHALDTFEAMQRSGCKPHAAVFSSIIDVLWQTGSAWAQNKALRLFNSAVESGSLAGAAESCKKGTLKVDLQALTVGVAVLSMAAWLKQTRQALLQDQAGPLDASRKLAVVNGLGEHSRAQGHSAAVKEAVGAGLLGCKAPFRLVQDHSRSGRLEASSLALKKWLFSDAFDAYLNLLQGGTGMEQDPLMSTPEYLEKEVAEAAKCLELFHQIQKYERMHPVSLKVLHSQPGPYLAIHKQLVSLTLHYAAALQLSQETAHTALALMDRCFMNGIHVAGNLHTLLVCACLRVAALQESSFLPSPLAIQALTNISGVALQRMETTIAATLNNDTECISAVHCLKIYLQRLGIQLSDGAAVRCAAGCAFALATQALAELPTLQYPPSLTAAAVLVAARKAQGSVPFWPSVLAQMTGYTEASLPAFAAAIGHADRLCTKLCNAPEGTFLFGGGFIP